MTAPSIGVLLPGGCKVFYRKDMTGIVTSLSPESMVHFIFSRKWFRLRDYSSLVGKVKGKTAIQVL